MIRCGGSPQGCGLLLDGSGRQRQCTKAAGGCRYPWRGSLIARARPQGAARLTAAELGGRITAVPKGDPGRAPGACARTRSASTSPAPGCAAPRCGRRVRACSLVATASRGRTAPFRSLAVQSRHLLERIEGEAIRFGGPPFADELVRWPRGAWAVLLSSAAPAESEVGSKSRTGPLAAFQAKCPPAM